MVGAFGVGTKSPPSKGKARPLPTSQRQSSSAVIALMPVRRVLRRSSVAVIAVASTP
jgi:hypothetical protein